MSYTVLSRQGDSYVITKGMVVSEAIVLGVVVVVVGLATVTLVVPPGRLVGVVYVYVV